jgi:hypothetical protein
MNDPIALVRALDADAITARLEKLFHERQALLVLLRAAARNKRRPALPTSTTPAPTARRK